MYAVIQPNYAIFGVGDTVEAAWADAEEWAENFDGLDAVPCTQRLFDAVKQLGGQIEWEIVDGVADLPSK